MAKLSTGARFNLGEPWDSDLADFLAAHFGASATEVVRVALRAFINDQLAKDPESKKRFDEARRKRLGLNGDKIRLFRDERSNHGGDILLVRTQLQFRVFPL